VNRSPSPWPVQICGGLAAWLGARLRQTFAAAFSLFKVMIPVIIAVKILQEYDLVEPLARPLEPVMGLVGLPGVFGLAWASAMLTSMYSGLVVFAQLALHEPVTIAQATVLATMMLVAHNLLVESAVARASGTSAAMQLALRLAGALIIGAVLNQIYLAGGWLQEPARIIFTPEAPPATIAAWALGELRNLGLILVIIFSLMVAMGLLELVGATALLNRLLAPVLRLCGIGPAAAPITVVGMTLGLAYGGGLIIQQARSGSLSKRDVVFSLTLMGFCHAVIEDTMIMVLAGAHFSGILWGRLIFSLLFTALLVRLTRGLPERVFDRLFWPAGEAKAQARP